MTRGEKNGRDWQFMVNRYNWPARLKMARGGPRECCVLVGQKYLRSTDLEGFKSRLYMPSGDNNAN